MADFVTPSFLQNCSADDWTKKMFDTLPAKLEKAQGGHTWNVTRPTALALAEMCEFILPEVIKVFCPDWSYGEFADKHADARGMTRRAATPATGKLTITGAAGATIPAGSIFSTAAINDEPSTDYKTLEDAEIPASGSITVDIECTQTGTRGNAAENTIILVGSRLTGITGVTNPEAVSGGTEEEDDESLIKRIAAYDKSQGESYVGSVADYKRWAESVPGVGEATVISAQDDSGLVTIIISDANGAAATESLCEDVYNYIMRPDSPGNRLAPPNANLAITPPATIDVAIQATIELDDAYTIEAVRENFAAKLATYLPKAMDDGEIKYSQIWTVLGTVEGVNDFADLKIGINKGGSVAYGTSNITISKAQLPSVSEDDIHLTSGTV